MNTNNPATILVISESDRLRDGLIALLNAIPQVVFIGEASSLPEAVSLANRLRPDIAILDLGDSVDAAWRVLRQMELASPRTRCIALIDDVSQQHRVMTRAVEAVLIKGTAPADLIAAIERML